jgi:hypothetical protein
MPKNKLLWRIHVTKDVSFSLCEKCNQKYTGDYFMNVGRCYIYRQERAHVEGVKIFGNELLSLW